MKIGNKINKRTFRSSPQTLELEHFFCSSDIEKISNDLFRLYPVQVHLKIFNWYFTSFHLLGKTQPVGRFGTHNIVNNLGTNALFSYQQSLINKFIDSQPQSSP